MKEIIMQAMKAVVLMEHELTELVTNAGKTAAQQVLEEFRLELNQSPEERQTQLLRRFIEDRSTIENPRGLFANSRHIRKIAPNKNGQPKSVSWFQKFKKESTLQDCVSQSSPEHGRLREWCFEDIANAWECCSRRFKA